MKIEANDSWRGVGFVFEVVVSEATKGDVLSICRND
jgi:hypothetical protein